MLFSRTTFEPNGSIVFLNRPLPPPESDALAYVEEQIADLLTADEILADVTYRFVENSDAVLIALARNRALAEQKLTGRGTCFRVPAAIALYSAAKEQLGSGKRSLVYGVYGDQVCCIVADPQNLYRVIQLKNSPALPAELSAAFDRLGPEIASIKSFYYMSKPDAPITAMLKQSGITLTPLVPVLKSVSSRATLEMWDFRLDAEVASQERNAGQRKVVAMAVMSTVVAGAIWLMLAGVTALAGMWEEKTLKKWQTLSASLKEFSFLQKQTRELVAEITLCKTLSQKRTSRSVMLEKIARTRPEGVVIELLQAGEGRKTGAARAKPETTLLIKGYCPNGGTITEWMEELLKISMFTSVNLVAMERRNNVFRFHINCTVASN